MLLHKILLKDVMVSKPFTIGEDEPFSRVWDIFRIHKIRHLPVLDNARHLKGIITQRDLYRTISPYKTMDGNSVYNKTDLDRYILKHIMTKEVVVLSCNDTLGKAIEVIVQSKYGCIPIINKDRYLEGIVTQIDVLRAIAEHFI